MTAAVVAAEAAVVVVERVVVAAKPCPSRSATSSWMAARPRDRR